MKKNKLTPRFDPGVRVLSRGVWIMYDYSNHAAHVKWMKLKFHQRAI